MTVVVAKRGEDACPLGRLRGGVEGIPFQNTDVHWTPGVGSDGEDSSSSGRVGISVPIPGGNRALFLTSVFGDMERGQGQGTRKISHIYGAPTMNQVPYT